MKVVILGSSSFIAENYIRSLIKRDDLHVFCFARNFSHSSLDCISYLPLDLNNLTDEFYFHLSDADFVLNFISNSNYLNLLNKPTSDLYDVVLPVLTIIEFIALNNKHCHYIHFGSRLQYGGGLNLNENSIRRPEHPYSIHKQLIEEYCHFFSRKYSLKFNYLILSNPFGFHSSRFDKNFSFVNLMLDRVLSGYDIEIYGDGNQIRDVIFIDDLLFVLDKLLFGNNQYLGTINIGSGLSYSIKEVAECIVRVVGRGNMVFKEWPHDRRSIETGSYSFDISRLSNILGTYRFHTLEEGLLLILKSY